jgi:hypothetical protein
MPDRLVTVLRVVLASGACCVVAGCGDGAGPAPAAQPSPPPAEHPLLGAPDPAGPTARGVFLNDPDGQVETIAAGGHLVAWTVRTPADEPPADDDGIPYGRAPKRLPTSTKIVIADERGGTPITVDVGPRWVSRMRMLRGPGGPAEPQLAVESCASRSRSTCTAELLTLTPAAPVQVTTRTGGPDASAAANGSLDSGRRLEVKSRKRRSCTPRLSVREQAGGPARTLPRLPAHDNLYTRCNELTDTLIFGNYAFAWVRRSAPRYEFDADFVYAIDFTAGASARWREIYRPYRYTDGSAGFALGPAMTDRALFWEESEEEDLMYSLQQVALPRDVRKKPTAKTPVSAEPIAPNTRNACDIAATDDAIYELANPRCTIGYGDGTTGGEIRRVVNPRFRPATSSP